VEINWQSVRVLLLTTAVHLFLGMTGAGAVYSVQYLCLYDFGKYGPLVAVAVGEASRTGLMLAMRHLDGK
jgi:hypothetical protein